MASSNDDLQKQIEQLRKEKEKAEAEKAKIDAEKALAEAKKALEQATAPTTELAKLQNEKALADARKAVGDANKALQSSTPELSRLQDQKALADAQKALADSQKALEQAKSSSGQQVTELQNQKALSDAQKALSEAQTQAAVARYIGDVKTGPYTGAVDVKEKTGKEEALLLAAHAVKKSAEIIATEVIATEVKDTERKYYIFGLKEFPSFQRLLSFRFRKETLKQAFAATDISKPVESLETPGAPALVSAGLEAFSKILGFFKSDYTVGGIDTTLEESILLFSVAGTLTAEGKEVHLPTIFQPTALDSTIAGLITELAELQKLRTLRANESSQKKESIADFEKKAADPQNAATKDDLLKQASALKPRLDQLNGVIALYDSFISSLTTPDTNGALPLTAIAQEFAIDTALKGLGAVLLLKLENSGGGYLVKKNLWTGLGCMPLFHSGGATVSYLLLSGSAGNVMAANVIPFYGGFVRSDKLCKGLEI